MISHRFLYVETRGVPGGPRPLFHYLQGLQGFERFAFRTSGGLGLHQQVDALGLVVLRARVSRQNYPLVSKYKKPWKITMLLMGKSTISMAIFNSDVCLPEGNVNGWGEWYMIGSNSEDLDLRNLVHGFQLDRILELGIGNIYSTFEVLRN